MESTFRGRIFEDTVKLLFYSLHSLLKESSPRRSLRGTCTGVHIIPTSVCQLGQVVFRVGLREALGNCYPELPRRKILWNVQRLVDHGMGAFRWGTATQRAHCLWPWKFRKGEKEKVVWSAAGWDLAWFCGNVEHFKNADVSTHLAAYGSLLTEICYCNLRIMIISRNTYSS